MVQYLCEVAHGNSGRLYHSQLAALPRAARLRTWFLVVLLSAWRSGGRQRSSSSGQPMWR